MPSLKLHSRAELAMEDPGYSSIYVHFKREFPLPGMGLVGFKEL